MLLRRHSQLSGKESVVTVMVDSSTFAEGVGEGEGEGDATKSDGTEFTVSLLC